MSLYDRTVDGLERRRENIINGGVNCIPWGMPRFESIIPGIEQGRYYMVTANAKVGKSQITDQLFVYNPYKTYMEHQDKFRLKIFYFSLEMADQQKMQQAISNLLYQRQGLRFSPTQLRSTQSLLDESVMHDIKSFDQYFYEYEKVVTYVTNVKHPYGIFSYMKKYALANGEWKMKPGKDREGKDIMVRDYYVPNDPDEYVIVIVDHASLLAVESQHKKGVHDAIGDLSSKYFVELRNFYGHIPVIVQQQMSGQEDFERVKAKSVKPSFAGLADNKKTQRDIDVALGLYTPIRYGYSSYIGYDINHFQDNIRFLEVIGAREGGGGKIVPLFFDGAVNFFKELPRPNELEAMQSVYNLIGHIRGRQPVNYIYNG